MLGHYIQCSTPQPWQAVVQCCTAAVTASSRKHPIVTPRQRHPVPSSVTAGKTYEAPANILRQQMPCKRAQPSHQRGHPGTEHCSIPNSPHQTRQTITPVFNADYIRSQDATIAVFRSHRTPCIHGTTAPQMQLNPALTFENLNGIAVLRICQHPSRQPPWLTAESPGQLQTLLAAALPCLSHGGPA
jgi:hypothetical protein